MTQKRNSTKSKANEKQNQATDISGKYPVITEQT